MNHADVTIVGVDVSKDGLDVNVFGQERVTHFVNDKSGRAKLVAWLRRPKRRAVVGIEPSGGYERALVKALITAGIETRFADAGRVRALARAHGAPAKTDPIDARFIARFIAEVGGREIRIDPVRERLADLLAARRTLLEAAQALSQRAALIEPGAARTALLKHARAQRAEAKALDAAARALIKADPVLASQAQRMQTMPGCGPLVAMTLIAELPELGALEAKQIARLVGLAPFIRKSGAWAGHARIEGGRTVPRNLLYLAAMAAKRADPALKAFFDRLVGAGKSKMTALVAVMRKLATILNAIVRDGTQWTPAKIASRA